MRDAFVKTLFELAKENKNIFALVGDIGIFTYDDFRKTFPNRYLNLGAAESNMMGVAAGLALCKKTPFVYTIIPFLTMRCYEQIRVDVCFHSLNVKIVGVGAGLVYSSLGATHHAIEDIAIMRVIPNMVIISPADPKEVEKATKAAVEHDGPVYIRLRKNGEPIIHNQDFKFEIGKAVTLKDGRDATIIATGPSLNDALLSARNLSKEGIDVRVIDMHTIKPIDEDIILQSARETKAIVTLEEHNIIGGLGSAVAEVLSERAENKVQFKRIGIQDVYCRECGSYDVLKEKYKISYLEVARSIKELI